MLLITVLANTIGVTREAAFGSASASASASASTSTFPLASTTRHWHRWHHNEKAQMSRIASNESVDEFVVASSHFFSGPSLFLSQ